MGTLRKKPKSKPSPPNVDNSTTDDQPGTTLPMPATKKPTAAAESPGISSSAQDEDAPTPLKSIKEGGSAKQLNSKSSWYGTWPRKSTASTQVARETILADKSKNGSSSTDLSQFEPKKPQASTTASRPPSMYLGKSKETLDITMGSTLEDNSSLDKETKADSPLSAGSNSTAKLPTKAAEDLPPESTTSKSEISSSQRPVTSSGWLGGWISRPTAQNQDMAENSLNISKEPESSTEEQQAPSVEGQTLPTQLDDGTKTASNSTALSSWYSLWPAAVTPASTEAQETQVPIKTTDNENISTVEVSKPEAAPAAGSSWAFWATETSDKSANTPGTTGELAVSGQPSENKPVPATIATAKEFKESKSSKRGRDTLEVDERSRKLAQPAKGTSSTAEVATTKVSPPHLLIPSVKQTYRLVESPSILQQIARLLLHGHQPPAKHVFLTKEKLPKLKKATAIGIHGLVPTAIFRTLIGQPTGTSIKFMTHAAEGIRKWADAHGSADVEIKQIALEAEGKIGDRVAELWKMLLTKIDDVREADFILVACHSQGVPVAIMLIAKLIEFGVVSSTRIAVCAMAGVSLGPFPEYKSRMLGASATELFEFANPESPVSKRYEDSLRVVLKYGVRITYCGSLDDQVVPMESAIFTTADHPYIYRAVFIDGRIHAPDFLSHLVGFALKLRNLGVSDHGLIRELSGSIAGSLYSGEGHSVLYTDGRVYDLAIEYALETTSIGDIPLDLKKYEVSNNTNPYVLPWIMRGLLEEDFVKTELSSETTELLKQFDDWKPATKVLKDVKYRLEAVRSKL
ncbi:Uncharacterized protein LSUE1_G000542 [Lachnellula suecica]|uniref:YMC020W-like alpha/beta hydrolase domain-containing protein n=1 Tax=Lachnellula suecica TaxID=602035 RepID=A0A8T9CF74_9HELO|nr:Uncharacterized protein LSUE1_G000542 [Lachnellula suecica]